MLQTALAVVAGFFSWLIVWFAGEKILSAIFPQGFGAHQRAFTEALTNPDGAPFTANTNLLVTHIALCVVVTALSGFLAALIAGESTLAPLITGCLLLALGILKAVMSWKYVPVWYHASFTALLLPMAFLGGKLYAN